MKITVAEEAVGMGSGYCRKCSAVLSENNTYPSTGQRQICIACSIEKARTWQEKNPERRNETYRRWYARTHDKRLQVRLDWRRRLKLQTLMHYSPEMKCSRCTFSDIRALSIDHVNGDGAAHRRKIGIPEGGQKFFLWLRKQGYPNSFQVLCMNCQFIKRVENNEWGKHG